MENKKEECQELELLTHSISFDNLIIEVENEETIMYFDLKQSRG